MSTRNGIPADLENLLAKWKLECILPHLLAEQIDTDILAMMKLSHVRLLLQNFPLGIQIRFEYYLELWREKIGKPFQIPSNDARLLHISKEHDFQAKITTKDKENKATQTDLIIYNISSISDTNKEINKDATSSISCPEDEINLELPPDHLSSELSSTSKYLRHLVHQVDLLTILKNSTCGIGLITSYSSRQSFSNSERKLLIDTIVDHYVKNNLEFNVQISYALERAILKMFPSEKLCFYRTSDHGRIYLRYLISAKAAEKHGSDMHEVSNSMDYSDVASEEFEELYQFSNDHIVIKTNNTPESIMTDTSHIDGENDDTAMGDSIESVVNYKAFKIDLSENEEIKTENKIVSREVDMTPALESTALIRKMLTKKRQQIEDIDRPFINFSIPWHKVPTDVISSLKNRQALGKRLNVLANLIVDELRKISRQVPMRVLRAVSQQAVMKYPHSFLEKDSEGNIQPSTNTLLLSRLRNRNTFLNRQV